MKKKLIASVTSFALLFTTAFCGLCAPVHAAETEDDGNMPEIIVNEPLFVRDPETGHISMVEPAAYSRRSDDSSESSEDITPNSYIPSSFADVSSMYKFYPATRNQNPYGTCWAHAAAACAEFDMVKNHNASKYIDLSELQLAWFNYHRGNEPPGLDGDNTYIPSNTNAKHYLDVGGNMFYSMHTMAQWKTFTHEATLPYTLVQNNKNYTVPSSYNGEAYHNGAQLRNVRFHSIKSNPDSVKQAIIDHGAVYISYYADSKYYDSSNNSYNNTTNTTTNHDIIIVGWDDSRSAWLARNSWQVSSSGNGSQHTYFWLSYYDRSLASTAYSLDFEPYSASDNMYQHDGISTHAYISVDAAANVFTANTYMPLGAEKLDSIMIPFTGETNVNFKVTVYTDLKSSSPTSGHLHSSSTVTGWTTSKGIYTVDLEEPVYLSPGEKFSVVVKALNGPRNFEIENSQNVTYQQNGTTYSWFNTTASIDKGESFYYYNGSWHDAAAYGTGYGNMCIKAITSDTNVMKYDVSYVLDGGTNSSSNPDHYYSTQTGTFELEEPVRNGYHFLGWYSDPSFNNKVTTINYNSKKAQTFYARWCSNSNKEVIYVSKKATTKSDGSYKSYCNACGKYKGAFTSYSIASIGLNTTKAAYTGSNISPKPVIIDSSGNALKNGTDYSYSYNKSKRAATGRYYVTIKFKGRYSADTVKKYYTVVPKAPATASAVLYGYDDIKVSWSKCTGASGYAVYYKKATSSKYVLLKRTSARYIKKSNLTDNVKYNFKIVPYYKSGSTRYAALTSKVVSATTLKKLKTPFMYTASDGRVFLEWEQINGADGYQVYWSSKKNGKYYYLNGYDNRYIGLSFSVGKNVTYWYKTRAYKKVGSKKIYGPFSTPKAYRR